MENKTEIVDLFEGDFKDLPENLIVVLEKYSVLLDNSDKCGYELCSEMLKEVEEIGYTFDYYLDAVPYNLRKL